MKFPRPLVGQSVVLVDNDRRVPARTRTIEKVGRRYAYLVGITGERIDLSDWVIDAPTFGTTGHAFPSQEAWHEYEASKATWYAIRARCAGYKPPEHLTLVEMTIILNLLSPERTDAKKAS